MANSKTSQDTERGKNNNASLPSPDQLNISKLSGGSTNQNKDELNAKTPRTIAFSSEINNRIKYKSNKESERSMNE
eukprot:CAMPEP_0116908576 /NCGR_PEP_ID=MMETSP0467-20121206/13774_1 /TAXON_ID=283647 /ORGANISM="Mesodinium pulex, Strain SPMC105" /LENGTH=75 /DNA_ID=CAMNT_0004583793 /DNA_START=1005 /DNA_END=1232 /DNA_ORIENTATION=+